MEKLNKNDLILDEKDETGGLIRTCSSDILVTKCEGSCNSQVQPSVKTSTGFLKVNRIQ